MGSFLPLDFGGAISSMTFVFGGTLKGSCSATSKADLRTVYIQIFTLFKFDKNLKKYNRKTTLFIVK